MARGRKQIAFDIDTHRLRAVYGSSSWERGYEDIKRFMGKAGFQWRQGSVYVSDSGIAEMEVAKAMSTMIFKYPWLNLCMRDCTVTNIGKDFSLNYLFDKDFKMEGNVS